MPQHLPLANAFGWALLGSVIAFVAMFSANLVWEKRGDLPASALVAPTGILLLKNGGPVVPVDLASAAPVFPVEFADGSRLLVEPGARLEPLVSSAREVVLRLARGRTTFDITPGGPRRWVIEAGLVSVEVVGTRFSVFRHLSGGRAAVRVDVERGIVLVRGQWVPDGVARLEAGGSIDVVTPDPSLAGVPEPAGSAEQNVGPRQKGGPRGTPAPKPAVWRDAAAQGKYGDAYAALGAGGLARETESAASADDLFALADVARLSGHPGDAVDPLERLLTQYSSSARASLAAVSLARIELGLGRPAKASATFERALALGVPLGLEEDVRTRLVEAYVTGGNQKAARDAAAEYARRFPAGRRSADIARWLAR